jgi:hypothetical protein
LNADGTSTLAARTTPFTPSWLISNPIVRIALAMALSGFPSAR